jgi:hypothetical protein
MEPSVGNVDPSVGSSGWRFDLRISNKSFNRKEVIHLDYLVTVTIQDKPGVPPDGQKLYEQRMGSKEFNLKGLILALNTQRRKRVRKEEGKKAVLPQAQRKPSTLNLGLHL